MNSSLFKLDTSHWHVVRLSFLLAGLLVLASVALTYFTGVSVWLLLAAFVSLMLVSFALTGYCLGAIVITKLGVPRE